MSFGTRANIVEPQVDHTVGRFVPITNPRWRPHASLMGKGQPESGMSRLPCWLNAIYIIAAC